MHTAMGLLAPVASSLVMEKLPFGSMAVKLAVAQMGSRLIESIAGASIGRAWKRITGKRSISISAKQHPAMYTELEDVLLKAPPQLPAGSTVQPTTTPTTTTTTTTTSKDVPWPTHLPRIAPGPRGVGVQILAIEGKTPTREDMHVRGLPVAHASAPGRSDNDGCVTGGDKQRRGMCGFLNPWGRAAGGLRASKSGMGREGLLEGELVRGPTGLTRLAMGRAQDAAPSYTAMTLPNGGTVWLSVASPKDDRVITAESYSATVPELEAFVRKLVEDHRVCKAVVEDSGHSQLMYQVPPPAAK
jgi:hypothetical protein